TLWLAISSDDGLVADDYYKRGLAINQRLERSERAAALDLGAELTVAGDGTAHLVLKGAGADAAPPVLMLRLIHPTRAGLDRIVEVIRAADGSYSGKLNASVSGRWLVSVETPGWRLPAVEVEGALDHVRLGSAAH